MTDVLTLAETVRATVNYSLDTGHKPVEETAGAPGAVERESAERKRVITTGASRAP
jgi:hypothetical protein